MLPVSTLDADLKVRSGGYIFAPRENFQLVQSAFSSLKDMTGPEWTPKTIISDFKFSPGCLQAVFGHDVKFVGCSWHFFYQLPKHIKGYSFLSLYCVLPSFVRANASETIDHIIRHIVKARSVEDADAAFEQLKDINKKAYEYFKKTWWPEKERLLQVLNRDYFTLNHLSNSIAESTNGAIKAMFVSAAKTNTLFELIRNLLDKDGSDYRDELMRHAKQSLLRRTELFSVNFSIHLQSVLTAAREYQVTGIEQDDLVENESQAYSVVHPLSKSRPHRVSKLVGQELFTCSCKEDKTSGYPDRHVEAVAWSLKQPLDHHLYIASRWRYPTGSRAPVCDRIN
jgi:hypothetical protein